MNNSIDLDLIQELLAQPERTPRSRKRIDTRDRETWFKLMHNISGTCSNSKCLSPKGPHRVTSVVNDKEMCRYCFLSGWYQVND